MAKKGLDIDRIVKITGEALHKTSEVTSGTDNSDKGLRLYNKLTPENFEALTDKFGSKVVQDYIKEHEFKRMGVE